MSCRDLLRAIAIFALLGAAPLAAQTIHVPADQATIQSAIVAAVNGDTILVAAGTYKENIDFKGKAITLQSEQGPAVTILDGQHLGTVVTFDTGETLASVLNGFTIENGSTTFGAGIYILDASPTITGNVFVNNIESSGGYGAAIGGNVSSPDIERNSFENNSCDAQFLSGVVSFINGSSPKIANNVFANNPCRAINMTLPSVAAPTIVNNTIFGNSVGIRVDGRGVTSTQIYENNLIVNNTIGLEVDFGVPADDPTWKYNLVFKNGTDYSGITSLTGTLGNISADPLFVNSGTGDFHLQQASPAIDAGDNAAPNLPDTDFDGNPRILGGKGNCTAVVDLGAYEFARVSVLTFSPPSLTFPDQLVGAGSTPQSVNVHNTGGAAVSVCSVAITGDFSETNSCLGALAANGTCQIHVTFTPAARGVRSGLINVSTDDAGGPQSAAVSGNGILPVAVLSQPSLTFTAQLIGTTSTVMSVGLSNTGLDPLSIASITATGDFSQSNTCGSVVAPSSNCTINVTFAPTVTGNRSGAVTITDGAAGSPRIVGLAGTGADFHLAVATGGSTSQSVNSGQTATYNLQIVPVVFAGTVSLACSGAPPGGSCQISPASATLDGANAFPISAVVKTAQSASLPTSLFGDFPKPEKFLSTLFLAGFIVLSVAVFATLRVKRRALLFTVSALGIFATALLLNGCGAAPANPSAPQPVTYTLNVTGQASGVSRSLALTLVVK